MKAYPFILFTLAWALVGCSASPDTTQLELRLQQAQSDLQQAQAQGAEAAATARAANGLLAAQGVTLILAIGGAFIVIASVAIYAISAMAGTRQREIDLQRAEVQLRHELIAELRQVRQVTSGRQERYKLVIPEEIRRGDW